MSKRNFNFAWSEYKSDQASAKLYLTFTNVDLTNVRCQTVIIVPAYVCNITCVCALVCVFTFMCVRVHHTYMCVGTDGATDIWVHVFLWCSVCQDMAGVSRLHKPEAEEPGT